MNHIVFLVGPDMTGKSQIGHELSKRLSIPYYKASTEHAGFLKNQDRFINDIRYSCPARLDLLKQIGSGVIYDRGYPCEWVYSRIYSRTTDESAIRYLDDEYSRLGATIVLCTRSSFKGIVDDLDERLNEEKLQRISDLYEEFLGTSRCRVMRLNVDDEDLVREVNDIIKFLEDS